MNEITKDAVDGCYRRGYYGTSYRKYYVPVTSSGAKWNGRMARQTELG